MGVIGQKDVLGKSVGGRGSLLEEGCDGIPLLEQLFSAPVVHGLPLKLLDRGQRQGGGCGEEGHFSIISAL